MDTEIKNRIDTINQKINELNALYHTAAIKSGISDGEISIWSLLLCSQDEYSQQDLADILYLPKQTVNSIISNFVKKKFVFLEHVPGTRNRKVVRLTKEGREYGESRVMWIFQAEEKAMEEIKLNVNKVKIFIISKVIIISSSILLNLPSLF